MKSAISIGAGYYEWGRNGLFFLISAIIVSSSAIFFFSNGCGKSDAPVNLRIFHAAGFTPVLDVIRKDAMKEIGINLQTESSGSQVACRKVEELGRRCDLLILADNQLVADLLPGSASWRLDFANDEVVLGVGSRAPRIDEAEVDWVPVLLNNEVRFGRVDENQGPIGYRALLVLKLEEQRRNRPGLMESVIARSAVVVDDVNRLAPLLKNGDIDYAFVYRSICMAMDMRFVELAPQINLGHDEIDYSSAEVSFEKLGAGEKRTITVKGAPATWTLTIPDRDADNDAAWRFIRFILEDEHDILAWNGFRLLKTPIFFGPRDIYERQCPWIDYGGPLK